MVVVRVRVMVRDRDGVTILERVRFIVMFIVRARLTDNVPTLLMQSQI